MRVANHGAPPPPPSAQGKGDHFNDQRNKWRVSSPGRARFFGLGAIRPLPVLGLSAVSKELETGILAILGLSAISEETETDMLATASAGTMCYF